MKAHELNLPKAGRPLVDPTTQQTIVVPEKVATETPAPLVSKTNIQGGLAAFKAQTTGEGVGSLLQAQVQDEKKHRGRTSALKPSVINGQLSAAEKKAFREVASLEQALKALNLGEVQ